MSENNNNQHLIHNHLWRYFKLNTKQRTTVFNFYILIFIVFLAGASILLMHFMRPGILAEVLALIISISFFYITVVFNHLDNRSNKLKHIAEDALIKFENNFIDANYRIFNVETSQHEKMAHTNCFRRIYILAHILSGALALVSVIMLLLDIAVH